MAAPVMAEVPPGSSGGWRR